MSSNRILLTAVLCLVVPSLGSAAITNIQISGSSGSVTASASFVPAATLMITENVQTGGDSVWDLQISVTRTSPGQGLVQDEQITIEKHVSNLTGVQWDIFRVMLGTGLGAGFIESDEAEFLFFNADPSPNEETAAFQDPPTADDAVRADSLSWFGPPGLPANGEARFRLSVTVPHEMFANNAASFTLRERASNVIPEPSSIAVWGLIITSMLGWRRRFLRHVCSEAQGSSSPRAQ